MGGWREKLSPAQIDMVTAYAGEALVGAGYPAGVNDEVSAELASGARADPQLSTGESMTRVMKKSGRFLAMMVLLVPLAVAQKKDGASDSGTLRQAADPMGFWVGTTIQGRMWNHDPQYKPVMGREFNAGVSIVFPNLTEPERGRFDLEAMDEAMSFAKQHQMKLMGHCLVYRNMQTAPWINFKSEACGGWSAERTG